jgi:hypothetical protein
LIHRHTCLCNASGLAGGFCLHIPGIGVYLAYYISRIIYHFMHFNPNQGKRMCLFADGLNNAFHAFLGLPQ